MFSSCIPFEVPHPVDSESAELYLSSMGLDVIRRIEPGSILIFAPTAISHEYGLPATDDEFLITHIVDNGTSFMVFFSKMEDICARDKFLTAIKVTDAIEFYIDRASTRGRITRTG